MKAQIDKRQTQLETRTRCVTLLYSMLGVGRRKLTWKALEVSSGSPNGGFTYPGMGISHLVLSSVT
jgi:hypothetical protein